MAVMNELRTLTDLVGTLEIGAPTTAGSLTLLPLSARMPATSAAAPDYLLFRQAHEMGLISVEETSEAGTVNELRVSNRASQSVLVVEGEVILGMKQTRVLNLTILVPPQSTLTVPVSCVESGRWRATSAEAIGWSDVNLAPSIRAAKTVTVGRSMRTARTFASDQRAVWEGVGRILDLHGVDSPSDSYADLMADDPSLFGTAALGIEPGPHQVGVIACIGGHVACVDVFGSPQVLAALWESLITSYQAESIAADARPANPAYARRWFRSIVAGTTSIGPDLGLGAHITVVAPGIEAAALVHEGRVCHLSGFPAHNVAKAPGFIRPSRRRS